MPYYRRFRGTRAVGKQKWSIFRNSRSLAYTPPVNNDQQAQAGNTTVRASNITLVENIAGNQNFVPPVLKIAHFKSAISCTTINVPANTLVALKFVLMYLPQGVNFNYGTDQRNQVNFNIEGTYAEHPEWVLAEKIARPATDDISMVYLSTPIKKNLNSGDRIILICYSMWLPNAIQQAQVLNPMLVNWSYAARTN